MAANPDESRRNHEAEIAAAALLLGQRYSLPNLIRTAGVRPRRFRQIAPTEALRSSLASPYLTLSRAWQAQLPAIAQAYELARITGDTTAITRAVESIARQLDPLAEAQARRFSTILAQFERWHRTQWIGRVRSATGLDVSLLTTPEEVRPETETAVSWNSQLIADVHHQASHGIVTALLAAAAVSASAETARRDAREVVMRARKRGLRIGVDQTDKTSRALDRARRRAAGLGRFRWHHTPQPHPRHNHLARDGKTYTEGNAPNDRAGALPFCKCWEEPIWD